MAPESCGGGSGGDGSMGGGGGQNTEWRARQGKGAYACGGGRQAHFGMDAATPQFPRPPHAHLGSKAALAVAAAGAAGQATAATAQQAAAAEQAGGGHHDEHAVWRGAQAQVHTAWCRRVHGGCTVCRRGCMASSVWAFLATGRNSTLRVPSRHADLGWRHPSRQALELLRVHPPPPHANIAHPPRRPLT